MLRKRRPAKGRTRYSRRIRREINFPQLRREIRYVSEMAFVLNQSDFVDRASQDAKVYDLASGMWDLH